MIPEPQATDVRWAIDTLTRRAPIVNLADRYYRGAHRLSFLTDEMRGIFAGLFSEFALNLCEPVVDMHTDRLEVVGWADDNLGLEPAAAALWESEELATAAQTVHREALLGGSSAMVIWPSPDMLRPVFFPQHSDEMAVRHDNDRGPRHVRFAVKWWRDRDARRARLTVYYSDRIERYSTPRGSLHAAAPLPDKTGDYTMLADDDLDGSGLIRHGWGVTPVVEFTAGPSILRSVVPVQDMLNATAAALLVGSDMQALPQWWGSGFDRPVDPITGAPVEPKIGPGKLLATSSVEARFGALPAGDISQLVAAKESAIADVVRVAGVPAHAFGVGLNGQPPSGEALKVAEARMVARVRALQAGWSRRWGQVMAIGLRMTGAATDAQLRALWRSPESQSARDDAEVALMRRQIGVSRTQALRELGYSDEQIDVMLEETAEDERRLIDSGLAA